MSIASLNLFNAVPENPNNTDDYHFSEEYGVVITPKAIHCKDAILDWLRREHLNGRDLNKSFHKSWQKVRDSSNFQLVLEQVLHYITTYGFDALGVYSDDTIYIPPEVLGIPEKTSIKAIHGLNPKVLIDKCFSLLSSGVALEQETIQDILTVLDECEYEWSGFEDIKNKEAACLVFDKLGILPRRGDELFRYLFYKATDSTLIIKNEESVEAIQHSKYELPQLNHSRIVELSKSFNRHKKLWMAFKSTNRNNRATVNKITKLSKVHHEPLEKDVLGNLTGFSWSYDEVKKACEKANIFKIIRAANAVRLYQGDDRNRFYKIRNGKGWVQTKLNSVDTTTLRNFEKILIKELRSRIGKKKIYCPPYISYALPVSEKQFVGNVPIGTMVQLEQPQNYLLMGIYWEGRVDLDLRADSFSGSIGWNASYRDKDRGLMFSGDVTSAPNGATEWMYCKNVDNTYLLKVNLYMGQIGHPYKIILGYGSDVKQNYMIDPSNVFFQADACMDQREILLGMLDKDLKFYLIGQGSGGSNIGGFGERSRILQNNLLTSNESMLRLNDVIQFCNEDEAEMSLHPDELQKDSILSLLK